MRIFAIAPRYLAVGGTCALLNAGVLIGADGLRLPLATGIAASFVIVCLAGYCMHTAVTFGAPASWQGLIRYTLAMAASLPASVLLLWLFASVLHWPMAIAAPCATAAMLLVNFLSTRWAVMRRPRQTIAGLFS